MYKFATKIACRSFIIITRRIAPDQIGLLAIIVGGCILRILALLNNASIEIDGIQYARIGEAFAKGRLGDALSSVFSPGYPLLIGLFHFVVPDLELAGRLVSVVFGTLLIWLSFSLGKRVLKDNDKALWVSFLTALHPHLVRYSGEVLSESLATFLFTLAVFLFYAAWQENRRVLPALSGVFLGLTYLTRPEYLIYYAPLILVFLWKRRFVDSLVLFLPLFLVSSLYVFYLHSQTGLWLVSMKMTLSPFVSLPAFFKNIPIVSFYFVTAISPLFFALAVVGFRSVDAPYRNVLLLLLLFHVLSLSFISHSTKRYSVEFAPLCLIFAVEGVYLALSYAARFINKRLALQVVACAIIMVSIFQAYRPMRFDRLLHKKAGLFLLSRDPGSTIASRLPIVAFYSKGQHIALLEDSLPDRSIERFDSIVAQRRVKYLIFEEEIDKELTFLGPRLSKSKPIWSAGNGESFVRIYQLF